MHPHHSQEAATRDPFRFLLALFLLSLACRWVLIHFGKEVAGTDEVIYLTLGRNFWHGLGFRLLDRPVTMCPPLLPVVAGFFSLFTDDLEFGTNFVYVVFGAATVIPYFMLARRVYGERTARRAAMILAFYPGLLLVFYGGSMTEPLYTFLLVATLLFLHRSLAGQRRLDFAVTGALLGLVYLVRSEGILFFPVLFLYTVIRFAGRGRLFQGRTVANLLVMALLFVLVMAPYPLFLKRTSGELSISGKTKLILLAGAMAPEEREKLLGRLNAEGTEFFDYQGLVKDKTVLGMIKENPKVLIGGSVAQIRNFFVTLLSWQVFPAFLAAFLLLGLFGEPWDADRLAQESLLATACLPFFVFLTFRIWPRYLVPMTPILLLWTARGVVTLEDWLLQTVRNLRGPRVPLPRALVHVPMLLLSLPLLAILVAKPVKARLLVQYPVEYRAAGRWIDAHLPPDAILLARKPEVAFYGRRLMHPLPNEPLPAILRYARFHHIDYLVVDEFFISTRPQLAFLLEDGPLPPDLVLVHETRAPNGRRLRIFRIREVKGSSPPPARRD